MTTPLADYAQFAGKRIAIVEHMQNHPFVLGLRQAQEHGLEVWLLTGDRSWYTHGHDWDTHPLAIVDRVIDVDTTDLDAVLAVVTGKDGAPWSTASPRSPTTTPSSPRGPPSGSACPDPTRRPCGPRTSRTTCGSHSATNRSTSLMYWSGTVASSTRRPAGSASR